MFADISGSTRLYEIMGDAAARSKVAECLELMTDVIHRHHGTVIKTIGDEIMCTFERAEHAGVAACEMHEAIEDDVTVQSEQGPISTSIRIGMHHGPAILEGGDVFGDAVNIAARMASMAKADQIITTQDTFDEMSAILRASTRMIDRAPVKGKKQMMDIYELIWQQDDVTRMSTGIIQQPEAPARLMLKFGSTELSVNSERSQVVLGRSKTADITVPETLASRQHVRIEHRRGKFFIIDQSTNGTYVNRENGESFLRREEMPLTGSGYISLGRSFSEDPQEVVYFEADG
ncbi:MAG: adenylate/guanylate cyclase domain-containing protein [Gammaproteobacteria bacterium]|nr:adenylate/guanylate cyclase domain-containing protein [Gammaproteobacteria bacterium]NNM01496.1 adenylate/guanylate cyclase domain-containing protein [Gammaproteobacteria bacterium]